MGLINRYTLFICLVAGISLICISLVFTASFFFSLTTGFIAYLFAAFGVINDIGKVVFLPAIFYFWNKGNKPSAIVFSVLFCVCFLISLVASQAFDLNKKNEIKNESIVSSQEYKRQNEVFNNTSENIKMLRMNLEVLQNTRKTNEERIRASYAPLIENARKLNMLTINPNSVAELTKKMQSEIKALDSAIQDKQNQIINLEKNLVQNNNFKVSGEVEYTEGLLSFAKWMSGISGVSQDNVIGYFYIIKNIFSEFLALGLLMLGGLYFDIQKEKTIQQPKQLKKEPVKRDSLKIASLKKSPNVMTKTFDENEANFEQIGLNIGQIKRIN